MKHAKTLCQAVYAALGGGLIVFSIGFSILAVSPEVQKFMGNPSIIFLVLAPTMLTGVGCLLIAMAIFKWGP